MPCIVRRPDPLLLRGTLTVFKRRCGTPTCRCATGDPHESPALTFTEQGRTKTVTLRPADVAEVEAALARYEQERRALEARAEEGITQLRARLAARRRGTHR
jgi:hypothetical protein